MIKAILATLAGAAVTGGAVYLAHHPEALNSTPRATNSAQSATPTEPSQSLSVIDGLVGKGKVGADNQDVEVAAGIDVSKTAPKEEQSTALNDTEKDTREDTIKDTRKDSGAEFFKGAPPPQPVMSGKTQPVTSAAIEVANQGSSRSQDLPTQDLPAKDLPSKDLQKVITGPAPQGQGVEAAVEVTAGEEAGLPNSVALGGSPSSGAAEAISAQGRALLAQADKITAQDLRDQAFMDVVDYAVAAEDFSAASTAISKISEDRYRDTARGNLALGFARRGDADRAFAVIDQVEVAEIKDYLRLQVIQTLTRESRDAGRAQ